MFEVTADIASVRAQLGLGIDVRSDPRMNEHGGRAIAPAASAGAFAAVPLTRSWRAIGGPALDVRLAPDAGSAELSLFLGVQYGS